MSSVARAIALPGENAPVRFPSFPALERTSTLSFNAPRTWNVSSGGRRAIVTRQPAFPLWLEEQPSVGALASSYTVGWTSDTRYGGSNDLQMDFYSSLAYAAVGPTTLNLLNPTVIGSGPPPAGYPTVGMDSRTGLTPWVWVPAGSTAVLCLIPNLASAAILDARVNGQIWQPGGEVRGITNLIGMPANQLGGFALLPTTTGYWYRPANLSLGQPASNIIQYTAFVTVVCSATNVSVAASAGAAPTITVTGLTPTTALQPAITPNEFANSPIPWESTRATAVAALFTNITKVLNKEGTVQWGRLNPDGADIWNFAESRLQVLHPAEKAFLALETGTYVFVPPSTDQAAFWDHTTTVGPPGASLVLTPVYRLDNTALVLCGIFSDPDGSTSLAVNLDWHIEFRNVSALFPIGMSTMTLESFHQAQLALVEAGFFYANESHKSVLNRVIAAIGKYGPKLLQAYPTTRVLYEAYKGVTSGGKQRKGRKPKQGKQNQKKHQQRQVQVAHPGPPKLKSGLDMYLSRNQVAVPRSGPQKPHPTSGKGSGFR